MKKDIRDIFDCYTDEAVNIGSVTSLSPDKITELTKNRIKEEDNNMIKPKKRMCVPLLAAAIIVSLSFSAFAALHFLSPAEIAKEFENDTLAEIFSAEDTRFDCQAQTSGDYTFELLGIASGKGLSKFTDAQEDNSYIVGAIRRTDGKALADYPGVMITPLISGYKPHQVNAFTLGGGRSEFISDDDMTDYFIFECDNVEVFADHTIYMAVYEILPDCGFSPSPDILDMSDDGSIKFSDSFKGAHALFEIPIDKSKANPEAAKRLLEEEPYTVSSDNDDGDAQSDLSGTIIQSEDCAEIVIDNK